jgi:hypothetical protein
MGISRGLTGTVRPHDFFQESPYPHAPPGRGFFPAVF